MNHDHQIVYYHLAAEEWHALRNWAIKLGVRGSCLLYWLDHFPGMVWSEGAD